MKEIQYAINDFLKNGKRPTSERAHLIQQICDTLFSDKEFKKILGQTRQFTTAEVRKIFNDAKAWQINPRALFWKLVREKQTEIRDQLKEDAKKKHAVHRAD